MESVNIHHAKTNLSRLLARVEAGERIVIARSGKPVAMLVPVRQERRPRRLGLYAGKVRIADDFDQLPDDVQRAFEGGSE